LHHVHVEEKSENSFSNHFVWAETKICERSFSNHFVWTETEISERSFSNHFVWTETEISERELCFTTTSLGTRCI